MRKRRHSHYSHLVFVSLYPRRMAHREGNVAQETSAWLSGSHDLRQPTSLGMCVAQSTVSKAAFPECGGLRALFLPG